MNKNPYTLVFGKEPAQYIHFGREPDEVIPRLSAMEDLIPFPREFQSLCFLRPFLFVS